jgi:hypothetical protein
MEYTPVTGMMFREAQMVGQRDGLFSGSTTFLRYPLVN